MQTTALKSDQDWSDEPSVTSFFDAPFTAVSNRLMQSIYKDPDVNPATRLLTFIARYSTGYLKPEVVLREGFVLESTGMSRSSLYKAKKELIESGKVTVAHTQTGNCVYRLVAELQCLKGASLPPTATEKAERRWGSAGRDHTRPQVETPMYKENKENLEQHHSTPTITTVSEPTQQRRDDAPFDQNSQPTITNSILTDQLKSLGVSEFMARKLTRNHNEGVIFQALRRVKQASVENPAGYLVSEILRGGYGQPVQDPTKAARLDHEKVHHLRRTERQEEERAREHASSRILALLSRFESFPPDRQRELRARVQAQAQQEGFTRFPGWGESHPLYRGLLAEIVSRFEEASSERTTSGFGLQTVLRE